VKIFVLNGPELDRLGEREPEIYGNSTITEVEEICRKAATDFGLEVEFRQTNSEEELVSWLEDAGREAAGVVLNPAAFTHHSLPVRDAVAATGLPVIEVHISNIYAREPWRARSVISGAARGVISGLGIQGYVLAIRALAEMLRTG
jgi:3-dehydroquinate dehydratase-2